MKAIFVLLVCFLLLGCTQIHTENITELNETQEDIGKFVADWGESEEQSSISDGDMRISISGGDIRMLPYNQSNRLIYLDQLEIPQHLNTILGLITEYNSDEDIVTMYGGGIRYINHGDIYLQIFPVPSERTPIAGVYNLTNSGMIRFDREKLEELGWLRS